MIKISKFILILTLVCLGTGITTLAFADEITETTATDANVVSEAQISATDLEVSDPSLLPSHPFYFLKEWIRKAKMALTINKIKKAELENKFTNERLIEIKKMAENGVDPEKMNKAIEKYQNAMNKIKERADKIKENASNSEAVNKFLEKFTNHQVLQEKILQRLEKNVPETVFQKIKEAREQHIEKFGQVMQKLEDREDKIKEKIENALQNGDASNSEILNKIKEKMPDRIKEKLENAEEKVREKINNKLIEKAKEKNIIKNCPLILMDSEFCKNGKVKAELDQNGCVSGFECLDLSSGEEKACTQEYKPICGKNGKTYSNDCTAKNSNAEIAYEGECKKQNVDCKDMWWFDNDKKGCNQKKFCGAYMYYGLRTFEKLEDCKDELNKINSLTPGAKPITNDEEPEEETGAINPRNN